MPHFLSFDTAADASSRNVSSLRSPGSAVIVSSTSWTADEDFSLLLTALDHYQSFVTKASRLPKLLFIITGKGALKAAFERAIADRSGKWVDIAVRCIFLPARDYPILLGSADLGVSLHVSSSGRDLPMKVVDMFGCGVPVLAKHFECLGELVKDGLNGLLFETGEELGKQLVVCSGLFQVSNGTLRRVGYITGIPKFREASRSPIIPQFANSKFTAILSSTRITVL